MTRSRADVISEMVDSGLFSDDEIRQAVRQVDATQTAKPMPISGPSIQDAAPSNLLKMVGVASANAPGAYGTVLSGIPGLGNPSNAMPSLTNLIHDPGQVKKALSRIGAVQSGEPLSDEEKVPATLGTIAGSALEVMAPQLGSPMGIGQKTALKQGRRVFGYTKRFLKDSKRLEAANETVQTMMDQGVLHTDPVVMADKIDDIAETSGKKIGDILEKIDSGQPQAPGSSSALAFPSPKPKTPGRFFNPDRAVADLNELRPVGDDGAVLRVGAYADINRQIDHAIRTVRAHGNQPITLKSANQIKTLLQNATNYNGKRIPNVMDRMIAARFRQSVDDQLTEAANKIGDPKLAQEFKEAKALYGHAQKAKDPIFNRISSELGNRGIGLTDWITIAPQLATGDPAAALASFGAKKVLEKLGPVGQAAAFNKLSKLSAPNAALAASPVLQPILKRKGDSK